MELEGEERRWRRTSALQRPSGGLARVSSPTRLKAARTCSFGGGGAFKRGEPATSCEHALALLDSPLPGPTWHGLGSLSSGTAARTNKREARNAHVSEASGPQCTIIFFWAGRSPRDGEGRGARNDDGLISWRSDVLLGAPWHLSCCRGPFGICGVPTGAGWPGLDWTGQVLAGRLLMLAPAPDGALHGAGGSTSPRKDACILSVKAGQVSCRWQPRRCLWWCLGCPRLS